MVDYLFLDTSAIVKRYKTEVGTSWIQTLIATKTIILSEITLAEVAATIAALHRATGQVNPLQMRQQLQLFLNHCQTDYELVAVTRPVIDQAVYLTQNYRLRGCDSIQLATALVVNQHLTPLMFVAADHDLLSAAQGEGLLTDNPNDKRLT